jgi:hypothetical protein
VDLLADPLRSRRSSGRQKDVFARTARQRGQRDNTWSTTFNSRNFAICLSGAKNTPHEGHFASCTSNIRGLRIGFTNRFKLIS